MTAKFWVGGTGTWDNATTTHWSLSSNGAGGAAVPVTGDTVTFDASSGGGTVTADTTINGLSLASITMGAFTGTLDFSVNNPSITLTTAFSITGSGVRALKLGSGTFTLSANSGTVLDVTTSSNLTLTAGTSTILVNGAPVQNASTRNLQLGASLIWATITISNTGSSGAYTDINAGASPTIGTLNLIAPVSVRFSNSLTITNALNWAGTSISSLINVFVSATAGVTLTVASGSTLAWGAISGFTFAGNAMNATNTIDLHGNNMNGGSISPPIGGSGGSHMIGG